MYPSRRGQGRWVILGTHAGNDVVRVEPFAEIDLELALLWSEPASARQAPPAPA